MRPAVNRFGKKDTGLVLWESPIQLVVFLFKVRDPPNSWSAFFRTLPKACLGIQAYKRNVVILYLQVTILCLGTGWMRPYIDHRSGMCLLALPAGNLNDTIRSLGTTTSRSAANIGTYEGPMPVRHCEPETHTTAQTFLGDARTVCCVKLHSKERPSCILSPPRCPQCLRITTRMHGLRLAGDWP